jgi:hypothetical protein
MSATRIVDPMSRATRVSTRTNGPTRSSAKSTRGPASRTTGGPATTTTPTSGMISASISPRVGWSDDEGWASARASLDGSAVCEPSGGVISSVAVMSPASSGTAVLSSGQVPRRVPSRGTGVSVRGLAAVRFDPSTACPRDRKRPAVRAFSNLATGAPARAPFPCQPNSVLRPMVSRGRAAATASASVSAIVATTAAMTATAMDVRNPTSCQPNSPGP